MTLFYLNETTHFDQSNVVFYPNLLKKDRPDDASFDIVHLLHHFFHLKVVWVTTFLEHLMLHLFTKPDKP
jgi:hypothetical protein